METGKPDVELLPRGVHKQARPPDEFD